MLTNTPIVALQEYCKILDVTCLPGGGVMTLHDYGYLPPEVLKFSCFGAKFSNIHPASKSGVLPGTFCGRVYCYANFFCYANFSIVFNPIFCFGRANCLREKPAVSRKMYQNTAMSCFQRKP